jgi:hypothetical protein
VTLTLNERLLAASEIWSRDNGRSEATLATRVANDGKLFDRLRAGRGCNVATAERFFAFFRAPQNWPAGVPVSMTELLDGVNLGMAHAQPDACCDAAASSGKRDQISGGVAA